MQRNPCGNCFDLSGMGILWGVEFGGEQGTLLSPSRFDCQPRSVRKAAVEKNQSTVGIANVVFSTHSVRPGGRLMERILSRNQTVLRAAVFGAPAACRDAKLNGSIQRSAVHPGLAAGNDGDLPAGDMWKKMPKEGLGTRLIQGTFSDEGRAVQGGNCILPKRS